MNEESGSDGKALQQVISKRLRGPYSTARCMDAAPAMLLKGIEQFNTGEFFEQHETLEDLWRGEPDDVRYLYQGILLVGVGLYHLSRGNFAGAVSKLQGGLDKLQWFGPACQGIDVARLTADARLCLEQLRDLGPDRMSELDRGLFPRVHRAGKVHH